MNSCSFAEVLDGLGTATPCFGFVRAVPAWFQDRDERPGVGDLEVGGLATIPRWDWRGLEASLRVRQSPVSGLVGSSVHYSLLGQVPQVRAPTNAPMEPHLFATRR